LLRVRIRRPCDLPETECDFDDDELDTTGRLVRRERRRSEADNEPDQLAVGNVEIGSNAYEFGKIRTRLPRIMKLVHAHKVESLTI